MSPSSSSSLSILISALMISQIRITPPSPEAVAPDPAEACWPAPCRPGSVQVQATSRGSKAVGPVRLVFGRALKVWVSTPMPSHVRWVRAASACREVQHAAARTDLREDLLEHGHHLALVGLHFALVAGNLGLHTPNAKGSPSTGEGGSKGWAKGDMSRGVRRGGQQSCRTRHLAFLHALEESRGCHLVPFLRLCEPAQHRGRGRGNTPGSAPDQHHGGAYAQRHHQDASGGAAAIPRPAGRAQGHAAGAARRATAHPVSRAPDKRARASGRTCTMHGSSSPGAGTPGSGRVGGGGQVTVRDPRPRQSAASRRRRRCRRSQRNPRETHVRACGWCECTCGGSGCARARRGRAGGAWL